LYSPGIFHLDSARGPLTSPMQQLSPPTVLVVEDEESVRRMCARVLEGEGYRVLTAGDGLQALDLLESDGADIQLVITDLQMPRMSGLQLSARLASSRTALPVMFISGYNLERPTDRRILAKPFKPSDLVAVVQSMLAESTPLQTELRPY
jgi:two-component system, cell cycle sensor histidine kinase and response regulator CckA